MEPSPYPFAALVAQPELKLALTVALINPAIGGVLLEGPYGVGKTTAVRALLDLLPPVERAVCQYGCRADDPDAQCPACRERIARGEPLIAREPMRLIELPLNARLEDVVGGVDERVALEQRRVLLEPGVLAVANGNLLYVDEVNLLDPAVVDAILDAAAQGRTFVRRGAMVRLFESRFVLVGSMNPEEGRLRPQILDRFGLRVWVAPLGDPAERLEAAQRVRAYKADPHRLRAQWSEQTQLLARRIADARTALPSVQPDETAERVAVELVTALAIPSHRAEVVLLEAARAYAAFKGHPAATWRTSNASRRSRCGTAAPRRSRRRRSGSRRKTRRSATRWRRSGWCAARAPHAARRPHGDPARARVLWTAPAEGGMRWLG